MLWRFLESMSNPHHVQSVTPSEQRSIVPSRRPYIPKALLVVFLWVRNLGTPRLIHILFPGREIIDFQIWSVLSYGDIGNLTKSTEQGVRWKVWESNAGGTVRDPETRDAYQDYKFQISEMWTSTRIYTTEPKGSRQNPKWRQLSNTKITCWEQNFPWSRKICPMWLRLHKRNKTMMLIVDTTVWHYSVNYRDWRITIKNKMYNHWKGVDKRVIICRWYDSYFYPENPKQRNWKAI